MFWLGMLTMYMIMGVLMLISETFGDGVLDGWLYWTFTWWLMLLALPFAIIYRKIKKSKKNNTENRYKVK